MKDFLKFTLATLVGIVLAAVVLFFVGLAIMFNMMATESAGTSVEEGTVVRLDLSGTLQEHSTTSPLAWLLGDDLGTLGLDDVLATIRKARDNDHVLGIYLRPNIGAGQYASVGEIRDALLDFRRSGKFVVAYADVYTQRNYYLASAADHVLLNPEGMITWQGLWSSPMFYKDLMQKLGIEMQVFKVGTYKSAVEPYLSNDVSPASREQIEAYQHAVWDRMTTEIAASRPLTVAQLDEAANHVMAMRQAQECVDRQMVDTLIYAADVNAYLKTLAGLDEDDSLPMLTLEEMKGVGRTRPKDKSGNIIAVYYAEGEIVSEASSALPLLSGDGPTIEASKMVKTLGKLARNDDVRAVVLRINSPGGSAFSSEQIWHAVEQLKEAGKPVVVSMGDVAASGGYYIACGAQRILAEPTTLTGSIGIYGMFPNVKGLNDLIGLHYGSVKTHPLADFQDYNRPMNEAEKAIFQAYIEHGYELFLKRCCDGRGMDRDAMDRIAQGRIWAGSTAVELGLVDELGGLDRAIELAEGLADVHNYTLMTYPEQESLMEQLTDLTTGFVRAHTTGPLDLARRQLKAIQRSDIREWVHARLPLELNMN